DFTTTFKQGGHTVSAAVSNSAGCSAPCSTSVTVTPAPTIACSGPLALCGATNGATGTVSVNVGDSSGSALVVVFSVARTPAQTNQVPAGGPPTSAQVNFTNSFAQGTHTVAATVSNAAGCSASCSTTVTVEPGPTIVCPGPLSLCGTANGAT